MAGNLIIDSTHVVTHTVKRKSDGSAIEGAAVTAVLVRQDGEVLESITLADLGEGVYTARLAARDDVVYGELLTLVITATWAGDQSVSRIALRAIHDDR